MHCKSDQHEVTLKGLTRVQIYFREDRISSYLSRNLRGAVGGEVYPQNIPFLYTESHLHAL